jgi:uncharacterized membrane protein YbaN (DUF454 family)
MDILITFLVLCCVTLEKSSQRLRDWLEQWELHLSMHATYAKLWV